jgi:hypothetical protein
MNQSPPLEILLIGENQLGRSHLTQTLERLGCYCWFASTAEEVRAVVHRPSIRLILSSRPVTEQGALFQLLRAPGRSIFYSFPVEDGCLWFRSFPEIVAGQRMSAVRPSEFMRSLNDLIIRLTADHPAISTNRKPASVRPHKKARLQGQLVAELAGNHNR